MCVDVTVSCLPSAQMGCFGNLVPGARVLVKKARCGHTDRVWVGEVYAHVAFWSVCESGCDFSRWKCFHCVWLVHVIGCTWRCAWVRKGHGSENQYVGGIADWPKGLALPSPDLCHSCSVCSGFLFSLALRLPVRIRSTLGESGAYWVGKGCSQTPGLCFLFTDSCIL